MNKELITFLDPKSPVSEMFRTLRTNIQFMNSDKELKTLLVSSTLPGEGKSWTAANLAVTFAQAGKKVLIVDGDMRKGRQFNIFGVAPTPGLSNYLSGVVDENVNVADLKDFIQETEIDNLFIIPAGNVPPNPSELLVSEKMLNLNRQVKELFDITIFDGTPSLLVSDAPILSRIVDSTIIVTAHNETKIDNVGKVKKAIENVGGKVAGVVVNKIPASAKKYENTYYYGSTMPDVIRKKRKNQEFSWEMPKETKHKESKFDKVNKTITLEEKNKEAESNSTTEAYETVNKTIEINSSIETNIENEIKENWNKIEEKTWANEEKEPTQVAEPILSWNEKKADDSNGENIYKSFENVDKYNTNSNNYSFSESINNTFENDTHNILGTTQDVINQINEYLQNEKNKLKNGDFNG